MKKLDQDSLTRQEYKLLTSRVDGMITGHRMRQEVWAPGGPNTVDALGRSHVARRQ